MFMVYVFVCIHIMTTIEKPRTILDKNEENITHMNSKMSLIIIFHKSMNNNKIKIESTQINLNTNN